MVSKKSKRLSVQRTNKKKKAGKHHSRREHKLKSLELPSQSTKRIMTPLTVSHVKKESKSAYTVFFHEDIPGIPGQFIMLWYPGIDEKPLTVSYKKSGASAVTFDVKGNFTRELANIRPGAKLFYRGPFGNGYDSTSLNNKTKGNQKGKDAIIVAGGLGFASIATLAEELPQAKIIYGARDKEHLIFSGRFEKKRMIVCTDDGSYGRGGFTTDALSSELELAKKQKRKITQVFTCGPEIMMKRILDVCKKHNIKCQCSLERFMFCGVGICASCTCSGKRVCKDGPVFTEKELETMPEFGTSALLKSGRRVSFGEYVNFRS